MYHSALDAESSFFAFFWIPASAGMTTIENYQFLIPCNLAAGLFILVMSPCPSLKKRGIDYPLCKVCAVLHPPFIKGDVGGLLIFILFESF
jgi:hypothetical protein